MAARDPVWIVSPHLLVAQAVAAALRSVGTACEARAWDDVVADGAGGTTRRVTQRLLVALLDGIDDAGLVEDVARVVEDGHARVVVVTSEDGAVGWGGLLEGDEVDVVTTATSVGRLARIVELFATGVSSMEVADRQALRASWSQAHDRRREIAMLLDTLSPQQRRVLDLLASGRRVSEVGDELGVTRGTVRSHVKSLRAKLGARTQLEAVAMLHQALGELVSPELVAAGG